MIQSRSSEKYKNVIKSNIGKKVNLTLKRGRTYVTINECIIENAYNGIFVLEICGESLINCKKISVCYADLLTGSARLTLLSDSKGA